MSLKACGAFVLFLFCTPTTPAVRHNLPDIHHLILLFNIIVWWYVLFCASTWPLLCSAGDYPLDKTALHQRFPWEPWSLPLWAFRLSAWVWIFAVGIGQQIAIHCLLVCLWETERNCLLRELKEALYRCKICIMVLLNLQPHFRPGEENKCPCPEKEKHIS